MEAVFGSVFIVNYFFFAFRELLKDRLVEEEIFRFEVFGVGKPDVRRLGFGRKCVDIANLYESSFPSCDGDIEPVLFVAEPNFAILV